MLWLLPIGVLAGILTTVTGVGGGMVALSLLSLVMDPASALAISAAAFAIGNAHRAVLFARSVDRYVTVRFGAGLAVGAIGGALVVPMLPASVLRGALIGVAVMALTRALVSHLRRLQLVLRDSAASKRRPDTAELVAATPITSTRIWPTSHLLAGGAVIGAVGAGAGGAGVLVSPVLLSAGLRREAYVATVASCAIVLNGARVIGYSLGGLYHRPMLMSIALISAAVIAGNLIGRQLRQHVSEPLLDRIELSAPVVAIALTLLGV